MPNLCLNADGQWHLLRPMLLSAALDWIDPHGSHGWAPPNSTTNSIEPICSALNLCRFLLLREQAHSSNHTEVRHGFSRPHVLFGCVGCVPCSHVQSSVFLPLSDICDSLCFGCWLQLHEYWIPFTFHTQKIEMHSVPEPQLLKDVVCLNYRYAHHQASLP